MPCCFQRRVRKSSAIHKTPVKGSFPNDPPIVKPHTIAKHESPSEDSSDDSCSDFYERYSQHVSEKQALGLWSCNQCKPKQSFSSQFELYTHYQRVNQGLTDHQNEINKTVQFKLPSFKPLPV